MNNVNSSGNKYRPVSKPLDLDGTGKDAGIKGGVADRDWPYEPDDPDIKFGKDKPKMDFDPSDAYPDAIVNVFKKHTD